jgi:hypothetical protein
MQKQYIKIKYKIKPWYLSSAFFAISFKMTSESGFGISLLISQRDFGVTAIQIIKITHAKNKK